MQTDGLPRELGSASRAKMIRSAGLLIREHGVAGTSFARVIEHSGAPRGSIAHHFPGGKDELVDAAVRWAGARITALLQDRIDDGASAADAFRSACAAYERELAGSDYVAGCPVGAVAQEAFMSAAARAAVVDVLRSWREVLAARLHDEGHAADEARDLAELAIAAAEGAVMMVRVERSVGVLERVAGRVARLLER